MAFIKKHYTLFLLLLFLIFWSVLFFYISPQGVVSYLGVNNGYITAFLVAFLGGISTVINFPYQVVIFTLGAGGLNPWILGLLAGLGVVIGDSISYLIGYHGRNILPERWKKPFHHFSNWCLKSPYMVVAGILFFYGAIIPFPNDLIVIALSLGKYPFWKLMIPLGLGNITFNIVAALAGASYVISTK